MTHLTRDGTSILALRPGHLPLIVATVDPQRAMRALVAQGWRGPIAAAVAQGELTAEAARALGRMSGLVEELER